MKPTRFPGRLVVADEGIDEFVHLDMYRTNQMDRMRISVDRDTLEALCRKPS